MPESPLTALPPGALAVLRVARQFSPRPVETYQLLSTTRGDLNRLLDALLTLEIRGLIRWTRPRIIRIRPLAIDWLKNVDREKRRQNGRSPK